jgi:hypothetical protein
VLALAADLDVKFIAEPLKIYAELAGRYRTFAPPSMTADHTITLIPKSGEDRDLAGHRDSRTR